jgi:SPP1 gp7 family putative phage head morphogenesis protein
MPNQLRRDPTRTTSLRKQFVSAMHRRFNALSEAIQQLVVDDDAFGLSSARILSFNQQVDYQAWRFSTDAKKVEAYRKWLKSQVDAGILTQVGGFEDKPWTAPYIESAYRKGSIRAYTDLRKVELALVPLLFAGGQAEFLRTSFNQPVATKEIELLYTRSFTELQGVTAAMDQQMSRILADGFVKGSSTSVIARELRDNVDTMTINRADVIARTEIVRAYNQGQLFAFKELGVKEVDVMAEWSTADDNRVCPMCGDLEGVVLTIKDAEGLLPRHPNCRCAWIPVDAEKKHTGQLWDEDADAAIEESILEETPKTIKRSKEEVIRRSVWSGKNLLK